MFCILIIFIFINKVNASLDLTPSSPSSMLIEASTGKILFEKEAHIKRSPASMTKIMTFILVMEALENEKIKLTDKVLVSKNASGMGGTQIFIEENTYVSVEDLIKGLGIASANDAAVALSEYVGGTESNFVDMMNKKAVELGCKNTTFKNPHGLDEEGHESSAYDMSLMAKELVKYEYALKITSTYEEHINVSGENHWLVNTNKLVKFYKGVDGLKTGYTDKAKYCLTSTMKRNDMRLISVVMGVDNKDNRSTDTISLMEYGFSNYGSESILKKNDYSKSMFIQNANKRKINYHLDRDINIIVDKNTRNIDYKIDTIVNEIKLPLKKNDKVGSIIVNYDNNKYEYDLIVNEDINKLNFFKVIGYLLLDIFSGNFEH